MTGLDTPGYLRMVMMMVLPATSISGAIKCVGGGHFTPQLTVRPRNPQRNQPLGSSILYVNNAAPMTVIGLEKHIGYDALFVN